MDYEKVWGSNHKPFTNMLDNDRAILPQLTACVYENWFPTRKATATSADMAF